MPRSANPTHDQQTRARRRAQHQHTAVTAMVCALILAAIAWPLHAPAWLVYALTVLSLATFATAEIVRRRQSGGQQ